MRTRMCTWRACTGACPVIARVPISRMLRSPLGVFGISLVSLRGLGQRRLTHIRNVARGLTGQRCVTDAEVASELTGCVGEMGEERLWGAGCSARQVAFRSSPQPSCAPLLMAPAEFRSDDHCLSGRRIRPMMKRIAVLVGYRRARTSIRGRSESRAALRLHGGDVEHVLRGDARRCPRSGLGRLRAERTP